jgi:hypothetical protein
VEVQRAEVAGAHQDAPYVWQTAQLCLVHVTSAEFREQWLLQKKAHPYILVSIFSHFNELAIMLTVLQTSANARAIYNGNWDAVNPMGLVRFKRHLDALKLNFEDFGCGLVSL